MNERINMDFSRAYTQYLVQVQYLRSLGSIPDLDVGESRMLEVLASGWLKEEPITVMVAMVMVPEISTNTAHRRITSLLKKGMIDLVTDGEDRRIKYIVPTKATQDYFAKLGRCMGGPQTSTANYGRQYIKYVRKAEAARRIPIFQKLDVNDMIMLDSWGVAWHNNVPMGVIKALSLISNRATSSSVSRLHGLRSLGMIDLVQDDKDRRTKYILPTQLTQRYFAKLGRCIHQSLATH